MEPRTHERVSAAWERLLGLCEEQLFAECTVTLHGRLGDYPGVFVVERDGAVHVTAPSWLLDQTTEAVDGRSADELLSAAWWEGALGCTYEVRGPAVHHYLDHAVQLPPRHGGAVARMAALDDIAPLRETIADHVWEESGFDDDPDVVFVLETADGIVAASNLSLFDDMPADVGVLTHPDHRDRGHGTAVAAVATDLSVELNRLARWVARIDNGPSMTLAQRLGFEPWCRQLAVRPRP